VQELTAAICSGQGVAELVEFSQLMKKLWEEHRTSPTSAGEENFYAWGNLDYTVVATERGFDDLVEIKSRFGDLDIKRDDDGRVSCSINVPEKSKSANSPRTIAEILTLTIAGLRHYYYRPRNL
jgi:hypothetical protein